MLIKIRFNTETLKSPEAQLPEWRVLYNGKEYFARSFLVHTKSWSTCDEIEPGLLKWHVTTEGTPVWNEAGDSVEITALTSKE